MVSSRGADPVHCTTPQGATFDIELPAAASAILWSLSDRLAFPFSTFLAQGMVSFAEAAESREKIESREPTQ